MHEDLIAALFDPGVAAVIATDAMTDAPLWPEEQVVIAQAVPKRRREFIAGRACARAALERFGVGPVPIPTGQGRAPVWPAGFVGSITHCDGLCAAVVAPARTMRGLGLDAEPATPLDPALMRYICTATERDQCAQKPEMTLEMWGKLIFSAKEAFYKAYFQIARTPLAFHDVTLTFDASCPTENEGSEGGFRAEIVTKSKPFHTLAGDFRGRWRIENGFVLTGNGLAHHGDHGTAEKTSMRADRSVDTLTAK